MPFQLLAVYPHGNIAPAEAVTVLLAFPLLYQHRLNAANLLVKKTALQLFPKANHARGALRLYLRNNLIALLRGNRSFPYGIGEHVNFRKPHFFSEFQTFLKLLVRFPRKSHHNIRGYGAIGKSAPQLFRDLAVHLRIIAPVHAS